MASYPEAGVEVYRVPIDKASRSLADRKAVLRAAPDVRFAGGVFVDPVTGAGLYTEKSVHKFMDTADPGTLGVIRCGLTVKHEVSYATNAYFVAGSKQW